MLIIYMLKVTELNDFSISTEGIATALQDSAAALKVAGNDIDESIAVVTAANQILQSPQTAGKAMRTVALRLTGMSKDARTYSNVWVFITLETSYISQKLEVA